MSKISIKGAATGTGVFTLASPATNTDRTLTLPDEAGTVLTTTSGVAKTGDTMTGNLEVQSGSGSQLKTHLTGVTSLGVGPAIDFQLTQTNTQSALLGRIAGEFISGWGGDLVLSTKPANGTPDNNVIERMRIDSAGRVTMPYQPYFYAGSTHGGTYISTALMPYDTTAVNTGNHYNTSTYLFTAPTAGRYLFTVSALNYPSSTTSGELFFTINGGGYNALMRDNSIVGQQSINGSAILTLAANDTVGVKGTMYFYAVTGHGHFSGILLG